MNIKETIMHYVDCYSGSEERVIERTISKHRNEFKSQANARDVVQRCISWLISNQYLCVLNYNEMDEIQKQYFRDDCCKILKKVKRYSESEFFKEKYENT